VNTSRDSEHTRVVIALAGRRVDALDVKQPRFPAENVETVRERIQVLFAARNASALVCSAACGADLLALEAAERQQMRKRVVLPFSREVFRRTSVVDRPGDWGTPFDRALDQAQEENDLVVLDRREEDSEAYVATNYIILDEAASLARKLGLGIVAVVVWDQRSRGPDDITEQFLKEATRRGIEVAPVSTL
jgi:hypothetical protein